MQEALDAALAVGDFDAGNPAHHGTPEERAQAWNSGFESGDPSACAEYLASSRRQNTLASSQSAAKKSRKNGAIAHISGWIWRTLPVAHMTTT